MNRGNRLASPSRVCVDSSPVGTGKTHRAVERALRAPERWLFAVQRIDGVRELERRIIELRGGQGRPVVLTITSKGEMRGKSVRVEIESLSTKYEQGHVIAICTHAALMMSDLSGFVGWNLVVDEVPEVLQTAEFRTKLDVAFFEQNYFLNQVTSNWSLVLPTEDGLRITGSDLRQDDSHLHLSVFHQRVVGSARGRPPVVCNLRAWSEMNRDNVRWIWWSLFTLDQLRSFHTVSFLGNGFLGSASAKILSARSPDVHWEQIGSQEDRGFQKRSVRVSYFSDQRRSSICYFESQKGRENLEHIARYISDDTVADRMIWSSNEVAELALQTHLPVASRLTPKQAGTNDFVARTCAAMIYAAKPSSEISKVIEAVGITTNDWIETNEWETILQFVTRTSIRDPASREAVNLYVFDKEQADYLMRFFETQPHISAEANWINLGLDFTPSRSGPKPRSMSPEEAERKLQHRRKQKRDSQRRQREMKRLIRECGVDRRE